MKQSLRNPLKDEYIPMTTKTLSPRAQALRTAFGQQKAADAKSAARKQAIKNFYGQKVAKTAKAAARERYIAEYVAKKIVASKAAKRAAA